MDFFTNAIDVLQTLVIALGGGLCVWEKKLTRNGHKHCYSSAARLNCNA